MEAQEFNDDTKESGNIGAGQNVLALYEIVPVGVVNELEPSVDKSRYEKFHQKEQNKMEGGNEATSGSVVTLSPQGEQENSESVPFANVLFLVKIRWK